MRAVAVDFWTRAAWSITIPPSYWGTTVAYTLDPDTPIDGQPSLKLMSPSGGGTYTSAVKFRFPDQVWIRARTVTVSAKTVASADVAFNPNNTKYRLGNASAAYFGNPDPSTTLTTWTQTKTVPAGVTGLVLDLRNALTAGHAWFGPVTITFTA